MRWFMVPFWACFPLLVPAGCSAPVLEPIVKNGTWCATHKTNSRTYCRDFDDGQDYKAGWSNIFRKENRLAYDTIDCADHAPDSPLCSLLVATSQLPADDGVFAQLQFQQTFESGSGTNLEFSSKITDYDSRSHDVGLMAVYLDPNLQDWWLSIDIVEAGQIQLTECHKPADAGTQSCTSTKTGVQLALDAWNQFALRIIVNTYPSPVTLSYNGNPIANITITPPGFSPPVRLTTQWGANFVTGPANPMKLSTDNIIIEPL